VTSYELRLHHHAEGELDALPAQQRDRMVRALREVAATRGVVSHKDVSKLEDTYLYRVKVGDYRALIHLRTPDLRVVAVGHRRNIYDRIPTAELRAER